MSSSANTRTAGERTGCGNQHNVKTEGSSMQRDPVCGMSVDPATAKHRLQHEGVKYVFCSDGCLTKFQASPDAFVKASGNTDISRATLPAVTATPASDHGVQWTCPMHPQIVRDAPGLCPVSGTAVEPMPVPADMQPTAELTTRSRGLCV